MFDEEDLKELEDEPLSPIVPIGTVKYLKDYCGFDTDYILSTPFTNNDEQMGYLRGVRDVLGRLKDLERQ